MPSQPQPLRIAMISLHTSPGDEPGSGDAGGMNVVVRHQAVAMGAAGHEVDVITRRSSADQPSAASLAPGVTLRFLDAGPAEPVAKGRHEEFVEDFRSELARLPRYDVLHAHHWFSGMAALPLARELGIPHVQSFHSIAAESTTPLSHGERAESPGRLAGEARLAAESDAVVAISAAEADTAITRLGARPDRVSIVPPGVDGTLFQPLDGPRAGRPTAVVAGRLHPLKGFDLAIETIAAVAPELRPELVIAGDVSVDYDRYAEELAALARDLGVADDVRFVGPQSRVGLATLFRKSTLVLVPSHSETYGLVALEAAASGVPTVVAASGGLREAVVDGETGIVIDSRDPQVWGAAVSSILGDPGRLAQLGSAARRRAERFDWQRSGDALVDVYRTLLDTTSAAATPATSAS
ncbi:D-inositol-3-phosphate glycosyltransferase [Plantibacter flavus]|uniref:D-inositol 3-phosphate glycosyltransferase n=1 Tax=Plantibacter flavus TaxID=150123 RepID=A0A3N2C3M7_9MICO|nr:glycosyltransferase [Plantibacter flavus]ROR82040.1 D-inositol-3-phosphate glycosyltransferase [Plantibacter flavus]SMG51008.1 D-inositol-3-phosphate glycosyltransferase [Plantibacter flavus]